MFSLAASAIVGLSVWAASGKPFIGANPADSTPAEPQSTETAVASENNGISVQEIRQGEELSGCVSLASTNQSLDARVYPADKVKDTPANLFDGNTGTNYGIHDGGLDTSTWNNFIVVDLGADYDVASLDIYWEGAYSKQNTIYFMTSDKAANIEAAVSSTDTEWGTGETMDNVTGVDYTYTFKDIYTARYVKILFAQNAEGFVNTGYGCKIQEFHIFKPGPAAIEVTPASATIARNTPQEVTLKAINTKATLTDVTWAVTSGTASAITVTGSDNTYSVTASEWGNYTIQFSGTAGTETATGELNLTVDFTDADCVFNANTEITGIPEIVNAQALIDHVIPDNTNGEGGGWNDNALADYQSGTQVNEYEGLMIFKLKTPAKKVYAANFVGHTGTITKFKVRLFAEAPNTDYSNTIVDPILVENAGVGATRVDFPTTVEGVQYMVVDILDHNNANWAAKFREVCLYGIPGEETPSPAIGFSTASELEATTGTEVSTSLFAINVADGVTLSDVTVALTSGDAANIVYALDYQAYSFRFLARKAGQYVFTFTGKAGEDTVTGTLTFTVTGSDIATPTYSDADCLFINQGSVFDTQITGYPETYVDPADGATKTAFSGASYLIDHQIPENANSNGGGFADRSLTSGVTTDVQYGIGLMIFDLRRVCTAKAAKFVGHTGGIKAIDLHFYADDPLADGATPLYSQTVNFGDNYLGENMVYFFQDVPNVRYMVVDIREVLNRQWAAKFREVCLYGTSETTFDLTAVEYRAGGHAVRNNGTDALKVTFKGFNAAGQRVLTSEDVSVTLPAGSPLVFNETNKTISAVANTTVGIYPTTLSYLDPSTNQTVSQDLNIEVATADWTNFFNIARRYNSMEVSTKSKNGRGLGNPYAAAYAYSSSKGQSHENVRNLIDGEWRTWSITPDELAAEKKPAVVLDFGYSVPVNEIALHLNSKATDKGANAWAIGRAYYKIYGGNLASEATLSAIPTDAELDAIDWTLIEDVNAFDDSKTGAPDVHVWATAGYQFIKLEFYRAVTPGLGIGINEITVGGPEFLDASGNPDVTKYAATRKLSITTPTFDRSNAFDRGTDNDWLVTSTRINEAAPLLISYQAVDILGESFLNEGETVTIKSTDGATTLEPTGKTVHYRDLYWPAYSFVWPDKDKTGSITLKAEATHDGVTITSDPFTVYVISTRGNINRFSTAYDNAHNYSPNWNVEGAPDQKIGDRDLSYVGTAPSNAADGNYGSWYVIGYYGPGNAMGATYKYAADQELTKPYELVLDYRPEDDLTTAYPTNWAKEIDMIGLRYEGAFPRDYKVYILPMEEYTKEDGTSSYKVKKNSDGSDAWEEVAYFKNMVNFGIGQYETHRIYPADATNGMPKFNADGSIDSWKNVAAVKISFTKLGTQWGIKLFESALYGTLYQNTIDTNIEQMVYADAAGTQLSQRSSDMDIENNLFYSFDIKLSNQDPLLADYEAVYTPEIINEIRTSLAEVDRYRITFAKRKVSEVEGEQWTKSLFVTGKEPKVKALKTYDETNLGNITLEEVTASLDTDNNLVFEVPAVGLRRTVTGEGETAVTTYEKVKIFTDVVVENVEPTYYYQIISAEPLKADGTVMEQIACSASGRTRLLAPFMPFNITESSLALKKADGDFSQLATEETEGHHLGSKQGSHVTTYDSSNVFSLDGNFDRLRLVNSTLSYWDLYYTVALNDGSSTSYVDVKFTPEAKAQLNQGQYAASISGLAIPTELTALTADEAAPASLKNVKVSSLSGNVALTTQNQVTYIHPNLKRETPSRTYEKSFTVSTDNVASKVAMNDTWLYSEKVLEHIDGSAWNGIFALHVDEPATDMVHYAGFFATNDAHEAASLSDENQKYGRPIGTDAFWRGIAGYSWDNDHGSSNFGKMAVEGGNLGIYLSEIGSSTVTSAADLQPVYVAVTKEYPVAMGYFDTTGTFHAGPQITGTGITSSEHAASPSGAPKRAAASATHQYQTLSAGQVFSVSFNDIEPVTGIDGTESAAADLKVWPVPAESFINISAAGLDKVEIYSIDGALVKSAQASSDLFRMDVSGLSSGLYVVRAAGTAVRIIKK